MKTFKSLFILILFALLGSRESICQGRGGGSSKVRSQTDADAPALQTIQEFYLSKMDGRERPYAVCTTDDSPDPKPLIVIVGPGISSVAPPAAMALFNVPPEWFCRALPIWKNSN